jgi:molybdopterin/thiamine biosynthesis adenylyltransferase
VRCKLAPNQALPHDAESLEAEPWNFHTMDVIVLTEADYPTIVAIDNYCRAKGKKFILTQLAGVFGRVFNDFGENFEVLDKNGEELQDVIIRSITNEEIGIVELLGNQKHKFEDGDECTFADVDGMKLNEDESHEDEAVTSDSINETIHKVTVINPYSFKIGDTRKFSPYIGKGIVKQLRTKCVVKYQPFAETALKTAAELKMDENLVYADFEKIGNGQLSHIAFEALDKFRETQEEHKSPRPWNLEDALKFLDLAKPIADRYELNGSQWKGDESEVQFLMLFALQAEGVFNPLAAFFGGYVAQEVVKAITGKFSPANQFFYYDAIEVLPEFEAKSFFKAVEEEKRPEYEQWFNEKFVPTIINTNAQGHRSDGLRICLGSDLIDKLAYTNLFMVGAGAIGCELLKNYAMLGVGTGKAVIDQADPTKNRKAGSIVLTDPDIIEVSNLNR